MKEYQLDIAEFRNLLESYKGKPKDELLSIICNYFMNRTINKVPLSPKELKQLPDFINVIRSSKKLDQSNKSKVLSKINLLIFYSKNPDGYSRYRELAQTLDTANEEELLEYATLIIKNYTPRTSISLIEAAFAIYFKNNDDPSRILSLLEKYSDNFSSEELEKLKICFKDEYYDTVKILRKIERELSKKIISSQKLEDYLNRIAENDLSTMTENYQELLKTLFNKMCDTKSLSLKMDNVIELRNIQNKFVDIYIKLSNEKEQDVKIRYQIMAGIIELTNYYPKKTISKLKIDFEDVPLANVDRIITIDGEDTTGIDGAFSIKKFDDIYVLDVYVPDVPTFLRDNRTLCEEAYTRGCSIYLDLESHEKNPNLDMLPAFLSHKFLSLNVGFPKNVISFNFVIGSNGIIYSRSIDRVRIKVTDKLTRKNAVRILNKELDLGLLHEDLTNLKELCQTMSSTSEDKYLRNMKGDTIYDLVALPSVLVNYYVAQEADFAIYRDQGAYTKDNKYLYSHSATPLRKFVSDINLAFFLEQNKVTSFPDKDLNYVETNIDEIVRHLNEQDQINEYVQNNSEAVKKYVRYVIQ